jgi:hypothetical protein
VRDRRCAPNVERQERVLEHVAITAIFEKAEELVAWPDVEYPTLSSLQQLAQDFLYLRERYHPLSRDVQVCLARELRMMVELFHLALVSQHAWASEDAKGLQLEAHYEAIPDEDELKKFAEEFGFDPDEIRDAFNDADR